jgi:hypothetical protein
MYAAVRASIVWPEKVDDAVRLYRRWSEQTSQESGGLAGLLALGDRDTGQGIVVALYATEEALNDGGSLAADLLSRWSSLFAVPPIREVYDVLIHAFPARPPRLDDRAQCARVTTIRVRPETIDDALATVREAVLLNAQSQPGHRGFLSLGNRATGKTLHVTIWESEAALAASETSGNYQNQVARIARFLTEAPTREIYAVTAMSV